VAAVVAFRTKGDDPPELLAGESFGEQLLVARRLGDRVDPAGLSAAAQPYEAVPRAAVRWIDAGDSGGWA
jgi:hypothetical protein